MIVSHFPGGGADKEIPLNERYEYTSSSQPIDDGDGNWRIKFLSSGTLKVLVDMYVDIFAVGGGGKGGNGSGYNGGGGGGGGFTKTVKNIKLHKGKTYTVTIGESTGASSIADEDNVAICEAAGGGNASSKGGNGGSGGGPGAYASNVTGYPGSDGNNGTNTNTSNTGGTGQGTTTREFGEPEGDLYSGGGGGGQSNESGPARPGAEGGGGDGATKTASATAGDANTGGGGGGGAPHQGNTVGAAGGSGIVIIRNTRITAG